MSSDITFKQNKNLNVLLNLNNIKIESFLDYYLDNTFTVFKSINDIFYLIYFYKFKNIIFYNIIQKKATNQIKKAHKKFIINIKHYLDKINKRDLLISISSADHNIKIWNIYNLECLLNLKDIYKNGGLYSACLLNDNNKYYIISCNNQFPLNAEQIKIYDLNGNKIKEINDSNYNAFSIDSYYDNKLSKIYIITANIDCVISYDYNNNLIYHKYIDNSGKEYYHLSIVIYNKGEIIKLIESCQDGKLRLWNFHSGELLNKIKVSDYHLYGICLWNNEYLYVGCEDSLIKIIDINKGKILNYLIGHNNAVICLKKLIHPKYGEYLISQGYLNDGIKIWTKNINN